jgi:hypothetical protein
MQLGEHVHEQAALGWRERLAEAAGSAVHERKDAEGMPGTMTTYRFDNSGSQGRHDEVQLPWCCRAKRCPWPGADHHRRLPAHLRSEPCAPSQ